MNTQAYMYILYCTSNIIAVSSRITYKTTVKN